MSLPSSSSTTTSSPSLNHILCSPERAEDGAAARFNPLFIHTANATHNQIPKQNYNHSSKHTSTNSSNQSSNHSINSSHLIALDHSSINHSKLAANTCSSPMQAGAPPASSRKVHVVYYLSRSGQFEHPHLLEVSIPPNQGLYLRDVKRRLAVIRGKRLPSTFAWSYKRSYKNGYVWQDLCDDDLIFPAHGCEYVLKGSEILNDQRSSAAEEECAGPTTNAEVTGQATQSNEPKEHQVQLATRDPKLIHQNFYDGSGQAVGSVLSHVSMVESGTDAATQTEEDLRPAAADDVNDDQGEPTSNGLYSKHQDLIRAKHSSNFSPQRGPCTTTRPQNAIELNNAELASPPSSSSATNSPSPYKELTSTSSSSASGFTVATDCHSVRDSSGDHVKPINESIHPGSKTPGRPWMKKAIQKLEEQDEILCLHAAENAGGSGANGVFTTHENATGTNAKYRSNMAGNSTVATVILEEAEQSPISFTKPSRGKHSSALSLLQFMSCGGLDIKEQILPMSLYRLRSKGTPATANQLHMSHYVLSPEHSMPESFSTYGGSESGKLWTKLGKPKSLCMNGSGSKPLKSSGDFTNGESDGRNQHGSRHYSHSMQSKSPSDVANGSSVKPQNVSIPDVISIGRSSISDRSTNVSHELDYYGTDMHSRLKKSGEVMNSGYNNKMKGSPRFNARLEALSDLRNNEGIRQTLPARAVSGEILMSKGSPLFVPGKRHLSYSGTPLNYVGNGIKSLAQLVSTSALETHHEAGNNAMLVKQADAYNKSICSSSSCNPSRAFSDGEVSCMLTRNAMGKSGEQRSATINGYDQSMAQLWEELLAAPALMSEEHQQKDADFHRVRQVTMGSSSAWEVERTLQNAVELSLQLPLEHHLLHVDCPRKVKAEVNMKAKDVAKHAATSTTNSSGGSSSSSCLNANLQQAFGKISPKPSSCDSSNLCQRFLRSSPPTSSN